MLSYRHTQLPTTWPGTRTPGYARKKSPFNANWGGTLDLLERELRELGAKDVEVAVAASERHIRNDGGLRGDARIQDSAVIVSFTCGPDRLSFPCDRFNFWQDNVRAIALALEALRKVDRYGVQSGKQYLGFKALPSGGALAVVRPEQAAELLSELAGGVPGTPEILASADMAKTAYRSAAHAHHPDKHAGDATQFNRVQSARAVLSTFHGVSL